MEPITLHNYQAFLLDYQEGTLSPKLKQALLVFINTHPEIKAVLSTYENIILEADSVTYPKRKQLKKPAESADEHLVIDYLERNLPLQERVAFRNSLKTDATLKGTLAAYQKAILEADNNIIYPKKQLLKKHTGLRPVYYTLPIAASVLIALFFYFQKTDSPVPVQTAQLQPSPTKTIVTKPVITAISVPITLSEKNKLKVTPAKPVPRPAFINLPIAKNVGLSISSVALPIANLLPVKDVPLNLSLEPTPTKGLQIANLEDQLGNYLKTKTTALLGEAAMNSRVFQSTKRKSLVDFIALGINGVAKLTGANIGLKQQMAADGTPINTTITAGRYELILASREK